MALTTLGNTKTRIISYNNMKVNLTLPTSLNEIPLSRYQEFLKLKKNSNDEEFIAQKMVEIFCGIKLKEIAKIRLNDLNELIAHFTKLFSEKPLLKRTFKIKEFEFGFIPNLEDITFGEYVDLENYLQDWENFHKAMSVMFRPITKKTGKNYEITEYEPNEDMQNLMKFAPLGIAISAYVFFWNLGSELLTATMNYLSREMKTNNITTATSPNADNSIKDGVGTEAFMESLKETSQNLTKLQDLNLLNVLPISPSKSKKTKSKQTK